MPFNVLVVDDSATTRAMIISAIEVLEDTRVVEANNGFDALRLLPLMPFDLIITDINMPDISGLELINFLKKNPEHKNIPLIILSTEKSEKDKERGLVLGASEYLVKPFDPEKLRMVVEKYLKTGKRQ